jgi:hypothetical protein
MYVCVAEGGKATEICGREILRESENNILNHQKGSNFRPYLLVTAQCIIWNIMRNAKLHVNMIHKNHLGSRD